MRIGIDMLADQSAGRARGTGRYVRGLMAEMLREPRHDQRLYYYDGLPRSDPSRGDHVRTLPGQSSLHSSIEQLARANPDRLDLLLLTCPLENFQGYLPPFPSRRGPRLAAIIYDLIPLCFPDQYLSHPGIAQSYRRALAALRHYDLLLTISESGRRDVVELLGASPERVVNIGAGSDGGFFCPPANRAVSSLGQGITQPFVYALTALDYRKNLAGLLAALEALPARVRHSHQLVITCATSGSDDSRQVAAAIARSPITERVTLTGPLDDADLRTLYQHCAAFVFPSRYEGFGLPLVEAMQCGAAVVAGRNSSQVEVVGDAGLLANVDDALDVAAKIQQMLEDHPLAETFRARAIEQARKFAWPGVASRCWDALNAVVQRSRRSAWLKGLASRGRLAIARRKPSSYRPPGARTGRGGPNSG